MQLRSIDLGSLHLLIAIVVSGGNVQVISPDKTAVKIASFSGGVVAVFGTDTGAIRQKCVGADS